jgi:hypothetical protein
MNITGKVEKVFWYILDGAPYSVHEAFFDDASSALFKVRQDSWPGIIAEAEFSDKNVKLIKNVDHKRAKEFLMSNEIAIEKVVVV